VAAPAGSSGSHDVPALRVRGLTKQFPGVRALDGVTFDLRPGEVHAVLGENGAGKSTLMNLIYGLLRPDAGEMELWGRPYTPASPKDAAAAGIGMVHQHFMLIPAMTVVENLALGAEPRRGPALDLDAAAARMRDLSARYGIAVDPRARVTDLSVGMRQRVEILKALYRDARLLILDEPTALLTPQETRELFGAIRTFIARGLSVIFISHKLDEVLEISHRVTVLRHGQVIATQPTREATPRALARQMVGREIATSLDRAPQPQAAPLLRVVNLEAPGLGPATFDVRAGEILGIAGVEGNGQEALVGALAGLVPARGAVHLDGTALDRLGVRGRLEAGLGLIPSDRQEDGLVLPMTVAENLALRRFYRPPFSRRGLLALSYWNEQADRMVRAYDVRPPRSRAAVSTLSGGNQQKVVLAREIEAGPAVLIASQPTRGLDVGATEFMHRQLLALRDRGRGILLVSLDLDEILAVSDRISVLYRGRLTDAIARTDADREELGLLMMGAPQGEEQPA
jgi:general nucleoside transport system ATP-binding protein